MAINRKIFVVGGNADVANWMEGSEIVTSIADSDLVVFPGGADVNPMIYGDSCHPMTSFNQDRDNLEMHMFEAALGAKKKIVGICRGAQLVCAMSGGRLVQHQANEDPTHIMNHNMFHGEKEILVTSDHHQAAFPWEMKPEEFKVIGWTTNLSPFHHDGDEDEMVLGVAPDNREVEVCFYPKTNALGIQSHPEWMFPKRLGDKQAQDSTYWFRILLDRLIYGTL